MSAAQTVTVLADLTRCPACGCTERTRYHGTRTRPYSGAISAPEEHPVTHVTYRRTTCAACGQARRDKFLERRRSS